MQEHDPTKRVIDPCEIISGQGTKDLEVLLKETGYIIQGRTLVDLSEALFSHKPLLIEGHRGGGKTALAEALAEACNLPLYYIQGMEGLTLDDVLYSWDREGQNQYVNQALSSGIELEPARLRQWSREFLILGEALAAFERAASGVRPLLVIDEVDKLTERIEDTFLQLFGRGWSHVPRVGVIGVRERSDWPIVIMTSNAMRHDLSAPLRSRCIYTRLDPPSPREEVSILRARVPQAAPSLLSEVVKLVNYIRGMGAIVDKPGLRESIDLVEALSAKRVNNLNAAMIDRHLGYLAKRDSDLSNLLQGLARLEFAVRASHREIDQWITDACLSPKVEGVAA